MTHPLTLALVLTMLLGAASTATAQPLLERPYAPRTVQDPDAINGRVCDAMVEIEAIAALLERRKLPDVARRFLVHLRAVRVRLKQIRVVLQRMPRGEGGVGLLQAELLLPLLIDAENHLNQTQLLTNQGQGHWVNVVAERIPTVNQGLLSLRVAIGRHPTGEDGGVMSSCASCPTQQPTPATGQPRPLSGQACQAPAKACVCVYEDGPQRETICRCQDGVWLCSNHMSPRRRAKRAR